MSNNLVAHTLTYDLNGNLTVSATSFSTNNYEWDGANRLVKITQTVTNAPQRVSTFTYDGSGRRTRQLETTNGVTESEVSMFWCGDELCEERNADGSIVKKRFFDGGEQISGTNYFIVRDHLRSVREMTDAFGTIRARYDYDPYGRRIKLGGDSEADFGFTGHYYHQPSGLHVALYRSYNAELGRWLSKDPIAERGGINVYAYVQNNPISYFDPVGLAYGNPVSGPNGPVGPSNPYAPALYYPNGPFYAPPRPGGGYSLKPGGVVGAGVGAFLGPGVEAGYEIVKLPNGDCQLYYYIGFGAGIGASYGVQGGTTYNVSKPEDYEGYFVTLSGGLGPLAASVSAAPDAWPFPVNPAPAASAMGGAQKNLPKAPGGKFGGSASIRNYWKVGDPF